MSTPNPMPNPLATIAQYEPFLAAAIGIGVTSFEALKAALTNAGADDDTIAALEPKWDALVTDITRAAHADDGANFALHPITPEEGGQ